MAGPVFAVQDGLKRWVAASLLIILAGCTTPPVQPDPASVASSTLTPSGPAATPSPETPHRSRLADFISRRLLKKAEKPAPEPEVLAAPEAPVDEKYQFTGEDARELERGHASWYGGQFHGRRTASGEAYDKYALTAAHKTLPFGTIVRVRSLKLGREVDVRINDRGPFAPGRVIDVSQAAAEALGLMGSGVDAVSLKVAGHLGKAASSPRSGKKIRQAARRPAGRAPAHRRR
ncbi:MAG: septal ring lytic transglycosylase RlpA family protein [Polaromonas sp.]